MTDKPLTIISRAAASAAGLKRFYTGIRCGRGHDSERYVSSDSCLACMTADQAVWRAANWDRVLSSAELYRTTRRERGGGLAMPDPVASPFKALARFAKRRAIKYGTQGSHTGADLQALFERQGCKCAYAGRHQPHWCLGDIAAQTCSEDHILPFGKGGDNTIDNIQLTCIPCNQHKGVAEPSDFSKRIEQLAGKPPVLKVTRPLPSWHKPRGKTPMIIVNGEEVSVADACRANGIAYGRIVNMVRYHRKRGVSTTYAEAFVIIQAQIANGGAGQRRWL